jgi:pimeloyl-ACP methyl ester carboxylesterase
MAASCFSFSRSATISTEATSSHVEGEDGYLTFHGLRHHYIRWGDPGADAIVLVHGLMNNARYWEHIAELLVPDYCVYALDLRGHGESEHAPGGYLVWAFARDLHEFIQELQLEVFDLVAHSIGSRVAMAYARDHSQRIRRLVLADMGPEMARTGARGIRKSVGESNEQAAFETEAQALEHFAKMYPGRSEEFLMRQLMASLTLNEATGELVFRYDPGLHEATGKGAIVEIPFLWESLEHITCPTMVMRAGKSRVLSIEIAEQMVERIPDSRFVEIPEAGHQLPLHQPELFAGAVKEFLAN